MSKGEDKELSISEKIRALYPELSEDECEEIEDTLRRYHAVALRIYERRKREESESTIDGALTDSTAKDRMNI
ncbi:MAG: hypothetical protein KZQ99_03525 [Candidatus Thiodiazotropha sp. (ex Dulcina madagascariensis)]|nr:hypothetical protein [Candidatus Thiodiazotropha sp. (ex Dulcina madagascariensis)]